MEKWKSKIYIKSALTRKSKLLNAVSGKTTTVATIELPDICFCQKTISVVLLYPVQPQYDLSGFKFQICYFKYTNWYIIFENEIYIFQGESIWKFLELCQCCLQAKQIYWHIIKVIVSNIEQKHGISQTYLFTFDWYFLGDLSHRFKTLPQGNIPVLPESNMLVFAYFLTQVWWIGALFFW